MEARLLAAYGLIVVLVISGTILGVIAHRRRTARKRRLRGIKDDERSPRDKGIAA